MDMIQSYKTLIGADEVGNGCLAGPVVTAAVKAPKDWKLDGLNDSKKLSEKKRFLMRDKLLKDSNIQFSIAERSNEIIDKLGIVLAMQECFEENFSQLFSKNGESKDHLDAIRQYGACSLHRMTYSPMKNMI
jgi:ribonuclease HII